MTLDSSRKYDITKLNQEIFRACDIRGVVDSTLTTDIAYVLGLSFGTLAQEKQQKRVVVGRDGRLSGPFLAQSLIEGLMASGCEVIDLGQVPTPVVYFATHFLNTGTGIMVTGSHNPPNYNGFKMMMAGDTLAEDDVQALYRCMQSQTFTLGEGKLVQYDILDDYVAQLRQGITLSRPLKVIADCGSGVVGVLAEKLFSALGCDVQGLYCEVDGTFPYHHPDPGQPENLADLVEAVKRQGADVGFAFDGDGDRLGIVTNKGEIVWPDKLMMLFSKDLLQRMPNSTILFDVKCSKHLSETIVQAGGEPIMYKTGHALIKRKMRETNAQLAGEMSGHFFFKERWYGFDDACYAAARLLEILDADSEERTLSEIVATLPESINTPEINIPISEDKKFPFVDTIKTQHGFRDCKVITVDGIRVEFKDGWGLVRASNTTPCLVLRFEADDEKALKRIQASFKEAILRISPELLVPF